VRRTRKRWVSGGVLTLVVAAVLSPLAAPTAAQAGPTDVTAFLTLYGWADNSPPGPIIAHGCIHASAGGTGTYADPVTFATDVAELPWCTEIYVPYMQRYFIHEDECSECDANWAKYGRYRFDMWAGGDAASVRQPERRALLRCESAWTRGNSITDPDNPTVVVDPPPGLPVTTTPIFSSSTGCWPGPITVTNPGRQQTARYSAVSLQVEATDSTAGQTLSYSAVNLPTGLSIDAGSGDISGLASVPMRRKVTVTVSDSADSAAVSFEWIVKRP